MNPFLGWALAALLVAAAWKAYGWQGVAVAATVVVFWLLLQFNRAMRAMKNASSAPIGHIDSAVMLNAKLRVGMAMLQIVSLTRSLGQRIGEAPEVYTWTDAGGSQVCVSFDKGRCVSWTLNRPAEASGTALAE